MGKWGVADIAPQTGKLAIVTGATGGLGYETALVLAQKGASVILAGRNPARGDEAVARIRSTAPESDVRFEMLDLADLSSVSAFVAAVKSRHETIDLLINNAGVMALPKRQLTRDGFEMQLGTNYLGHFAMTLPLLPLLQRATAPRIVNLSSLTHRNGVIDLEDFQSTRRYSAWKAYAQSKLAMLIFAQELQRRSLDGGWNILVAAAHPGWARTDLVANGPASGRSFNLSAALTNLLAPMFGQSAAEGALPTLFAATAPEAAPGGYYGPDGITELTGAPAPARIARQAQDPTVAGLLWQASEKLTGVRLADHVGTPPLGAALTASAAPA